MNNDMNWKEFIFPACMITMIIGIPIGIVLWFNHILEM
jgi:ABC-type proline/glycine betaine transport system permease subunit